jgi:hypothetical protein
MQTKLGYHFTADTLRDGSPIPPIGVWLEHNGPVIPCESGLHMSEHPFDAMQYANGSTIHRVELGGEMLSHGNPTDKWVGSRRRILKSIDATSMLRAFARRVALDVIHLWKAPEIVIDYLNTGDESNRKAAQKSAQEAVQTYEMDAARAAVWAAVNNSCLASARDSAWAASWAAIGALARESEMESMRKSATQKYRQWFKESVEEEFAK